MNVMENVIAKVDVLSIYSCEIPQGCGWIGYRGWELLPTLTGYKRTGSELGGKLTTVRAGQARAYHLDFQWGCINGESTPPTPWRLHDTHIATGPPVPKKQ